MRRLAVLLVASGLGLSLGLSAAQAQSAQPSIAGPAKSAAKKSVQRKPVGALRPAVAAGGPCIGVFPLIGDRFAVKMIGLTVFGNEDKEITVDNWGLDDLVVERVQAAVGPGISVRKIATAKDAFDGYKPGIGLFQNMDEKAAAIVQQAAAQMQCERYIVVTRALNQYVGNQSIYGVGIVNSGRPILSRTALHAVIRIHVHDGRSFAVLKSGEGSIDGDKNFLMRGPPVRQLDGSWWPDPPEAANTPAMREATRGLLAEVLDKSLPELLAPQDR